MTAASRKLRAGDRLPVRELQTIAGAPIALARPGGLVHLQLRRFAGCPVCSLHLRQLVRRRDELAAAGVHEVVVFHSQAATIARYSDAVPFELVADPDKRLYATLGAEAHVRSLLDPRAWWPIARAVASALWGLVRGRPMPPTRPEGGRLGLPAEFLIAQDGRLVATHYGAHVDDQWSADELLALARAQPVPALVEPAPVT